MRFFLWALCLILGSEVAISDSASIREAPAVQGADKDTVSTSRFIVQFKDVNSLANGRSDASFELLVQEIIANTLPNCRKSRDSCKP